MLAASGRLRGILLYGTALNGSGYLRNFAPFDDIIHAHCQLRRVVHNFPVKDSWVLNCRRFWCNRRAVSMTFQVSLISSRFTVLDYATSRCTKISGRDFLDEEEVTDEELDKLISAIKTDPDAYRDVGSIYAEKLCKTGNFTALIRLVQALRENQVFLSVNMYNLILLAAGEANDVDLLFQTLKDMLLSNTADSSSYLNTAKAFSKTTDNVPLVKFVHDVAELTPSTGVSVLNRIIYSLAGCGQVDKALLIYDSMKSQTCRPDLFTYNIVLGILGRTGRVDEMLREFSCMKERGILPDLVSYNTLINSQKKVGRLDSCLKYLNEMMELGLEPDLRTYTALIESFGRSGHVEESMRLFDEMKVKGVRPSIYIYRSLIDSLKKVGKVEVAVKCLEEMNLNYKYLVGPKDFKRKIR